jgi:peptide/nickel transport system substrate-binding protein
MMLDAGNSDFPYIASDYHIPILQAKDDGSVDIDGKVRTGAYMLESIEFGVRARMKRNPNYHHSDRGWFDEVEIITIPDHAARQSALVTGDVDHIIRPDLKTLPLLQQNPDVMVSEVTGYAHYVFPMLVTVPPYDNPDVRLALKWAIDREEIAKKIFLGHASPGNDNPISPAVKFATNPEPIHRYDPEKAKFHLKKAGLSNLKIEMNLSDAAFNGCIDAGVLYKESAAKCGIDINVVKEAADSYWDVVWLKKPFIASYWSGRPTCDWMFTTTYAAGAAWNETRWENPRFNELLVAARAETDEAKRAGQYAEMQQLVHDDCGQIVIVFNNIIEASSKKLAHGDIAPNWELDGMRIAERWWFA